METIRRIATAALLALMASSAFAQSEAARQAFEVASVSPTKATNRTLRAQGTYLTATNLTLRDLLAFAHDLQSAEISGPDWVETEGYDVTAKANGPATYAQHRQMLQALLEDHFQLVSHRETQERPVYWLIVEEGGPKLGGNKEQQSFEEAFAGKSPFRPGMSGLYKNANLPQFVERLAPVLGRTVLDKTGIEGRHWFQLEWKGDNDSAGRTALLAAVPEQLGLGLEEKTAPVEVLVIDRVEKPSEK